MRKLHMRKLRQRYGRAKKGGRYYGHGRRRWGHAREGYKRVGVAFSKPHGPSGRRDEYGIYESPSTAYGMPVEPRLYAEYEGYREGDRQVGIALGGRGWSPQPMIDFKPEHFGEVRFFDKGRY